jgi:hypothetical protein
LYALVDGLAYPKNGSFSGEKNGRTSSCASGVMTWEWMSITTPLLSPPFGAAI